MKYKYPNYETNPFEFMKDIKPMIMMIPLPDIEMFKIIDDYIAPGVKPLMYAVSSFGRIFNIRTGRELSQMVDHKKYYRSISLQINVQYNAHKTYSVHRLVALAYIPKTEEDIRLGRNMVNHKDLYPGNNYYKNLEWVTNQENMIHAYKNGVKDIYKVHIKHENGWSDPMRGETNGMARLTNDQVHEICRLLEEDKLSRKEIAQAVGLEGDVIDRALISGIATGKRQKEISSQYNIPCKRKK